MEKQSNVSWVLVGVKPTGEEQLEEKVLHKMNMEAFMPDRTYKLFLCGIEVDKTGTLVEMEEGYELLKKNLEEYNDGDYCIISSHEEGSLLFLPIEIKEEDAKNLIGNTNNI